MTVGELAFWFFLVPLAVSAGTTPLVRSLAHRIGFLDHPGGESYKWHDRATPYLGGLPIILATATVFVFGDLRGEAATKIQAIFVAAILCSLVGLLDDWQRIGAGPKMLGVLCGGLIVWWADVGTHLSSIAAVDLVLSLLWLAAITNAFNIIDNMDGVAVGVAGFASLSYFAVAVATDQPEFAMLTLSIAAACFGFLRFNFRPATIFLGDFGTMYLGLLLASVGMALDVPAASIPSRTVTAALIMGVPLFNLLLVIVSRMREGRPVTRGAPDGLSHRLTAIGLSRGDAARAYWMASAGVGAAGVSIATLDTESALTSCLICLVLTLAAIWGFEKVKVETGEVSASVD